HTSCLSDWSSDVCSSDLMPRRYAHPIDGARRYFTPGGSYPYRCEIRTPLGTVAPMLHSQHDMITVNEIFAREDYRVGAEAQVVRSEERRVGKGGGRGDGG